MNDTIEKITPAQISESQENLKTKYELEIETAQQATLKAKKELTDKDDEIFELQKQNKKLTNEVDEWKLEARRNRRIEQEKQATKQQNDFKTEYIKLQEQKRGWTWDERKGWVN
jgi:hypothetical protein